MNDTTLIVLAVGGYFLLNKKDAGAGSSSGGDSGTERVTSGTTSRVVDNKVTDAGSTAVEVANDTKIILTDAVDVYKSISSAYGSNSDDNSDDA